MSIKPWQELYAGKITTAEDALSHIGNGQTIYIGSGGGEPILLTSTLARLSAKFSDLRVIHLLAHGDQPLAEPELRNNIRYETFYIGRGVEKAVAAGTVDFTPMNLSDLPKAIKKGIVHLEVALIQVSPPDVSGMCSLGISVDAGLAAIEVADLVIAQVNKNMPITLGESRVSVDLIDFFVEGTMDLIEVPSPQLDAVSLTIGRHIAKLIQNGMTLHFDQGIISSATMRYLDTKRDLGIHTDILTDDLLRLMRTGAVNNRLKTIHKGKTVVNAVLGSLELYEAVHLNPDIEVYPMDYVNSPYTISLNDNMVSIFSVQEMELSGLGRLDMEDPGGIRSLPSSTDFFDGTRRSENGMIILALPSTTPDGKRSRIVAESFGRGVYLNRAKVDMVVTEYGAVNLYGHSIRERAIALISIAHPKFRRKLLEEAKRFNYVEKDQIISPESGCVYPHQYEFSYVFKNELEVFFRPVKPSDAPAIQRMHYTLSEESIRMRYHGMIKTLSNKVAQEMANIDYSRDMAIIGLVGPPRNQRIIAEGRYMYNPTNEMGEFDILVVEDFRGHGIGTFLANHLKKIAYSRGLSGLYCEIIQANSATVALIIKAWPTSVKTFEYGIVIYTLKFPEEAINRPKDSIIVYSGRFNDFSYGDRHPFRPDRARATLQLMRQEGLLDEPWMRVEEPRMITRERLTESHDPVFIANLERANLGKWEDEFLSYHLGSDDTPIFHGMFDYILLYTSATLTGVDLIINENANVVFNLLGGFHHATREQAEGFCYVNDIIVAIDTFLAQGLRVAYIDIDAHHGDGVQDAYYKDDRVLNISLHQTGKSLFPWGGFENEIGTGMGKGFNINIPLPEGTDDEAFGRAFSGVVNRAVTAFAPNVIVAVVGADTHKNDPLTNLNLTNNGMVEAVKEIRDMSNHLLLLTGGGYDVKSTSKAWCRIWAAANRIDDMPDYLLMMGGNFLGSQGLTGAEMIDRAYRITGNEKREIMAEIERIIDFHIHTTIPCIEQGCEPEIPDQDSSADSENGGDDRTKGNHEPGDSDGEPEP
jgi:acetoin utilization deacetylase AcuC-like enzyme/acyl-CoA hydrolase/GNAT superfamily N-acetyltransferase